MSYPSDAMEKSADGTPPRYFVPGVGVAGGLATLIAPIVLFALGNSQRTFLDSLVAIADWHLPKLFGIGVPLAVGAGWRCARYAQLASAGKYRHFQPPLEGFVAGFLLGAAPPWFGALNVAFAAGDVWDGAKSWTAGEWLDFVWLTVELAGVLGGMGAAYAVVLGESVLAASRLVRMPSSVDGEVRRPQRKENAP